MVDRVVKVDDVELLGVFTIKDVVSFKIVMNQAVVVLDRKSVV